MAIIRMYSRYAMTEAYGCGPAFVYSRPKSGEK